MNDHSVHHHDDLSSGNVGSSKPPAPEHKEPRQYFLPSMIIMQVDHPIDVDQCKLPDLINPHLKVLGDQLKNKLGDKLIVKQDLFRRVQTQNLLTFPRQDVQRSPFSLVRVELNSTNQKDLITILIGIYEELITREGPFELGEPGQGVIWRTISPNWLLGSSGHGKPHPPSPGSWPLAMKALKKEAWEFSLCEKVTGNARKWPPELANEGTNVNVAILDTAPCATDLDEAYESWHNGTDKIELIERLLELEPNRRLRLVTDFYAEIELLDCSIARHRYWMADHGLFIASEIAAIAPKSKIHLYKVFTSYGSASTLTIAQGLLRILTDLNDKTFQPPLIVNCSFGLAAPDPDDPDFAENVQDSDFPVELQDPITLRHMQTSLRELFDELTKQDRVIVVAAAGDDTDTNKHRAPTRLPAAYESVIGVGALPKGFPLDKDDKYKAASYSNLADNPPDTGYMTLGGEPRQGNGILGIYTSDFPDYHQKAGESHQKGDLPKDRKEPTRDRLGYTHNQIGSAEWAGASFAAPIITGILARWCSQQIGAPGSITLGNARQALNNISETTRTAANERVILVKQG